jgi:predicted nucleotidyltransferase
MEIIGKTAISHFGKDVKVYLFGSRTDPDQKGGDIDLLLDGVPEAQATVKKKIALIVDLKRNLGDQKIDVVLKTEKKSTPGFFQIIEKDMIRLC